MIIMNIVMVVYSYLKMAIACSFYHSAIRLGAQYYQCIWIGPTRAQMAAYLREMPTFN